jgi:hypothetical protein
MLFITTRRPLASARILSCTGVCTPVHYRCNPAGAVLVISDIWRCDGREILLPLMSMTAHCASATNPVAPVALPPFRGHGLCGFLKVRDLE